MYLELFPGLGVRESVFTQRAKLHPQRALCASGCSCTNNENSHGRDHSVFRQLIEAEEI